MNMRQRASHWLALLLVALLVIGCAPAATPTPASTEVPPSPTEEPTPAAPILTVSGPSAGLTFTRAELEALPVTEGYAGIKSSTGEITLIGDNSTPTGRKLNRRIEINFFSTENVLRK